MKSKPSFYRVSNVWVVPSPGDQLKLELDLRGTSAGFDSISASPAEFALLALMMAEGKPVYYSPKERIVSTDPSFGSSPDDTPSNQIQLVDEFDLLWDFSNSSGELMLELENRSTTKVSFVDAALLAGWALTIRTQDVKFDGTSLTSQKGIQNSSAKLKPRPVAQG